MKIGKYTLLEKEDTKNALGGDESTTTNKNARSIGVSDIPDSLNKLSAVQSGVRLRANALGKIPMAIAGIDRKPKESSALKAIFSLVNQYQLLFSTEVDLQIYGNAYWRLTNEFEYLPASEIDTNSSGKLIDRNSGAELESQEQIIHFADLPTYDRSKKVFIGVSPLESVLKVIQLALWSIEANLASEESYASITKHIVSVDPLTANVSELQNQLKAITALIKGVGIKKADEDNPNSQDIEEDESKRSPAGLAVIGKVSSIALGGNRDQQFIQKQTFAIQQVASALEIPSILINDMSKATYNNVKELRKLLYETTITARITMYESTINSHPLVRDMLGKDNMIILDTTTIKELGFTSQEVVQFKKAEIVSTPKAQEMLGIEGDEDAQDQE